MDIHITMNRKIILVGLVICLTGLAFYSKELETHAFEDWKAQYGTNWTQEEEAYRQLIFNKNLEIIQKHNIDPSQTYKMGVNQFTALSDEEFKLTYLSNLPPPSDQRIS